MRRGILGAIGIPANLMARITAAETAATNANTAATSAGTKANAAQSEATTLAQAVANANSEHARLDARIDAIKQESTNIATGTGRLAAALLVGASADITIPLSHAMADSNYKVELTPTLGMTLAVKSKTPTQVVVTVTAGIALSIGATFPIIAWS